jgi:transcriptional regulator with XRE-family HTH domain
MGRHLVLSLVPSNGHSLGTLANEHYRNVRVRERRRKEFPVPSKKTKNHKPSTHRATGRRRNNIGSLIRAARVDRGVTVAELARTVALRNPGELSKFEAGSIATMPAEHLERIAGALKLTAIQRRELLSSAGRLPTSLERALLKSPSRWKEVDELLRKPEPRVRKRAKWGAKHSFVMAQPHWMAGREIQDAAAKEGLVMSIPYIYNIRSKARRLTEDARQASMRKKVTGHSKQRLIRQFKDTAFVLGVPHAQKLLDEVTHSLRRTASD